MAFKVGDRIVGMCLGEQCTGTIVFDWTRPAYNDDVPSYGVEWDGDDGGLLHIMMEEDMTLTV